MKKGTATLIWFSVFVITTTIFFSCKKDKMATGTDKELYDMAVVTEGFTWYKNSSVLLSRSPASGHSQPFLRTRYNTIAAAMLDAGGKVNAGTIFPSGSLIVKELWDSSTKLGRYAILYKDPADAYADSEGWVWGYINADGTVAESSSEKGSSCIDCHAVTGNIDRTVMHKYHL